MNNLETIDILCDVNARLTKLVSRMATEMEQANIAELIKESIRQEITECTELTDRAEIASALKFYKRR